MAKDRSFNAFTVFRAAKDRRGAGKKSGAGAYPGYLAAPPTPVEEAQKNFSFVWAHLVRDESRYSQGDFPVLYTASRKTTTYREVGYHLHKNFAPEIKARDGVSVPHIVYDLRVSGLGRDFGLGKEARRQLCQPKKSGGYKACHGVALEARKANIGFLRVPSARCDGAENFPILNEANCSLPNGAQEVELHLTGNRREVIVKTAVLRRRYSIKS